MSHIVFVFTSIAASIRPSVFAFALSLPMNKTAFELVTRLLFFFLILLGRCWVCHSSLQRNKGRSECKVTIPEIMHVMAANSAADQPVRVIPAHEACLHRQTVLTISAYHIGCQWYSRLLGRQHYLHNSLTNTGISSPSSAMGVKLATQVGCKRKLYRARLRAKPKGQDPRHDQFLGFRLNANTSLEKLRKSQTDWRLPACKALLLT